MFTLPSALSFLTNKYVLGGLLLAALLGGVYYAGYHRGDQRFVALQAQIQQERKDAKEAQEALVNKDNKEKDRIQNEAKQQIASMSRAIGDLSVRFNAGETALRLCTAAGSSQPSQPALGSGTAASPGTTQGNQESIAISPAVLNDTLDTAIAAVTAELEWRDYARNTGQVK
jgi:hypothetical protein